MDNIFIQHSVKVLQALNKQRKDGSYCDATLVVGDLQLKAHWSILACSSPFFQSLYGDGSTSSIVLHERFSEIIGLLLDFLYTGELTLSQHNVDKVLSASKELDIFEAIEACEQFQPKCLTPLNRPEDFLREAGSLETLNRHLKQSEDSDGEDGLKGMSVLGDPEGPLGQSNEQDGGLLTHFQDDGSKDPELCSGTPEKREFKRLRRGQKTEQEIGSEGDCMTWELEVEQIHDVITDGSDYMVDNLDEDYMPEGKVLSSKGGSYTPSKVASLETSTNKCETVAGEEKGKNSAITPVECPTCHKMFVSKYYLKVHNRKHTGEKPFECTKCGKRYFRKENLVEHTARNCMSRTEQVFNCTSCPEVFKRRMDLRIHMISHTGDMPYKCTSCPQQFMQKKHLQSHMTKMHGEPKPHACSACEKCFFTRTELRLHEAFKHRGEKLFVCEECGHRASSRSGLQMHIKAKHRNERPYICEFCHRAFTQKANLNMHRKTHSDEKPFQCHLCGKTFRTQASLQKHNRTHTGERPFSCEFCDQRFSDKTPLLRHVASRHQEGRPHFCNICGKTFKAVAQLRVHEARHRGVRKFECTECGYKFTRQAHLRRHMDIHTRIENYNPRQRKLRNLIIEEEKSVVISLQSSQELDHAPADILVEAITPSSLADHDQRLCSEASFTAEVMEDAIIITATAIPISECDT
ncbi:zinc finger and BTB domain-containing protein 48 [Gastrophryne carolinensis]